MQLKVRNHAGAEVDTIEVDDAVFGITPNVAVMHQVVVAHQANRRRGTHSTLTRGEVEGSTRKIRSQKGTGRARQGSIRAPHQQGGGIVFGPKPRKYTQKVSKMLRRLAIRSALSAKVADNELIVIDDLAPAAPKTKEMATMLRALGVTRSPLIVTAEANRTVFLAGRNIEGAKVLPATHINTEDIIAHHGVVMTVGAVRKAEALWGGARAEQRRAPVEG
ncbi:MAG: 50S ribosomal protein L4 [Dehalococcoidia bacterium]